MENSSKTDLSLQKKRANPLLRCIIDRKNYLTREKSKTLYTKLIIIIIITINYNTLESLQYK